MESPELEGIPEPGEVLDGKYRIERRIASGGYADVYQAHDTIEGISVALKIPR